MPKQRNLEHDRIEPDDITQYEDNFIPTPTKGPWESDDAFDVYHCFDFFSPKLLAKSIKQFKALCKKAKLPESDFTNIENGISSFTNSSTRTTKASSLLYMSILNWQPDILTSKFLQQDEEVQQTIGNHYFEEFTPPKKSKVLEKDLIPPKSLEIYCKVAETVTMERLRDWVTFSLKRDGETAWATHFDRISIYRGLNNSKYYHKRQNKGDLLSIYTGATERESFPYFEKYLLSSYTLSPNLAEKFMVGSVHRKGRRRVLIEGHTDVIEGRLFTSFIVSPNFRPRQFEFICLPDTKYIRIKQKFNTDIHAGFDIYDARNH